MKYNKPTFNWKKLPDLKDKIHDVNWDNLIFLDACRFDFFRELININGKLQAVESEGGHTYVNLKRLFNGHYENITIFSNHPIINSFGYTPNEFLPRINSNLYDSSVENKWVATNHFDDDKIYDIGFDEDITRNLDWGGQDKLNNSMINFLSKDKLGEKNLFWLMNPHNPLVDGSNKIDSYINTLELTLKDLDEEILPLLSGKTIITSDHGECFMPPEIFDIKKNSDYLFHEHGFDFPSIRIVPWFEVNKKT